MSSREEQKEQYRIMIDNDKEFVIDSIIEKNNELTRQDVKIEELEEEIERLHSIIKEAKEYIEHNYFVVGRIEKIYKILDKENK